MSPPKVLFLGANGSDTTQLQLGAEVRDIRRALSLSGVGEAFDLIAELAVRPKDLQSLLLSHSPHVLHFSGHGSRRAGTPASPRSEEEGPSREFIWDESNPLESPTGGLLLQNDRGSSISLRPDILVTLLGILKRDMPLRCVVLNACYTAEQAEAITQHVDCVVGTTREINDDSAIAFTAAFYRAIAHGKSVADAFALGRVEIGTRSLSGEDVPKLFCRRGVSADDVYVVEKSAKRTLSTPPQANPHYESVRPEPLPSPAESEKDSLLGDLDKRKAEICKQLQDHPVLLNKLGAKLEVPATIAEIARSLFEQPAHKVATTLVDLDAAPDLAPLDREIVRKLLWQVLPLAIDWRDVMTLAKQTIDDGRLSLELPLRTETMAEVILAGVDGRACSLVDAKPYPHGTARIPMPSVMHAPLFNMEQHAVNALVKDLVDEKIAGVRSFRDYRGLPTQTDDEIEEAMVLVNELLADFARKDNPERMPHYLLFVDQSFRKDSSVDLDRLWADLSRACARKLPHLRLFRLQGGPKEFSKEIKIVLQIQKPLGKV